MELVVVVVSLQSNLEPVFVATCDSFGFSDANSLARPQSRRDGKVSALWPVSSLYYMQCLAEDRWEDHGWRYGEQRYAYWRDGFSWIEKPEADPLGIQQRGYPSFMSTIADRSSDLSYYLRKVEPLPKGAITRMPRGGESRQHPSGDSNEPATSNGVDIGDKAGRSLEDSLSVAGHRSSIVMPV